MATLSGTSLGKYAVYERLGRGGMAEVYKGRHERLDRTVAIKVLHSFLAEGDDFLARFEREARAVASLRHPHIVQVYDFDVEDESVYMVMEYISGGSLKDRLQQAAAEGRYLPYGDVVTLVKHIASALDAAHAEGMLHRDVKPANVMLDEKGRAYLADFGIARIVSTTQFTATGTLVGTPAYMSPEQGRGEALTPASDLYSLGVILYEMLTNSIPFDADTPLAIIHKQIHDPLPPARALRADLPQAIESVLERALAKAPEERFPSAQAFAQALEAVLIEAEEDVTPTMLMEPEDGGDDYKPTVALEADAGPGREPLEERERAPLDVAAVASPPLVEAGRDEEPQEQPPPERKISPVLIGVAAVVILVVIGAASGLFAGGVRCDSVESCSLAADQAMVEGDVELSLALLDEALGLVAEDEEQAFAELWCEQGHKYLMLDRIDEAIQSFERCAEWTHGNPELQPLREEAERMIMDITGG